MKDTLSLMTGDPGDNYTALNSTFEDDQPVFQLHHAWIAFQCVFFILMGGIGVFGNCVALVALATTPRLRNSCTALIGNLCVSDLISATDMLFLLTPATLGKGFPENMLLCKALNILPTVTYSVSLTTLIFIAFNRYLLITRPGKCYVRCCGRKQVVVYIAVIWLITFFVVVLPAISSDGSIVYDPETQGCAAETSWLVGTIMLSFYVIIPAFVLVPSLYGMMICAVKASHRRVHSRGATVAAPAAGGAPNGEGSASVAPEQLQHREVSTVSNSVTHQQDETSGQQKPRATVSRRELNLTRLPILIFIVFAVCWTPNLINHICSGFFRLSPYAKEVAALFILSNSAINPYLYAWSNRNFRQAYKRILSKAKSNCFD